MNDTTHDDMFDDGGPAFGPSYDSWQGGIGGASLADYIAINACETEYSCIMPNTTMACVEKCRQLGFLGEDDGYTPEGYLRLDAWGRYEYAAAMIAEKRRREQTQ